MQVHLDVPEEVARQFGDEPGGITRVAIEALALEGVRSGKLTEHQAREMLGIRSRYEMDGFLKARSNAQHFTGLVFGQSAGTHSFKG